MADQALEALEERLQKATLAGVNGSYLFQVKGDHPANYALTITDGEYTLAEGELENADCTLSISDEDLKDLLAGQLNPVTAFMSGKIKIQGNMSKAMQLQSILG